MRGQVFPKMLTDVKQKITQGTASDGFVDLRHRRGIFLKHRANKRLHASVGGIPKGNMCVLGMFSRNVLDYKFVSDFVGVKTALSPRVYIFSPEI